MCNQKAQGDGGDRLPVLFVTVRDARKGLSVCRRQCVSAPGVLLLSLKHSVVRLKTQEPSHQECRQQRMHGSHAAGHYID